MPRRPKNGLSSDVQRARHQRAAIEGIEGAPILADLSLQIRGLRMRHEQEFGAQQPDALGTVLDRIRGVGGVAQIGGDLDTPAIRGAPLLEA